MEKRASEFLGPIFKELLSNVGERCWLLAKVALLFVVKPVKADFLKGFIWYCMVNQTECSASLLHGCVTALLIFKNRRSRILYKKNFYVAHFLMFTIKFFACLINITRFFILILCPSFRAESVVNNDHS